MYCPRCNEPMAETYDAKTGENQMFECENCGFTETRFDGLARNEGYPADPDEFEEWRERKGIR